MWPRIVLFALAAIGALAGGILGVLYVMGVHRCLDGVPPFESFCGTPFLGWTFSHQVGLPLVTAFGSLIGSIIGILLGAIPYAVLRRHPAPIA